MMEAYKGKLDFIETRNKSKQIVEKNIFFLLDNSSTWQYIRDDYTCQQPETYFRASLSIKI